MLSSLWSQAWRWLKKQKRSGQKGPPGGVLSVLGAQLLNQLVQRSQLPPVYQAELLTGEKETQEGKEAGESVTLHMAPGTSTTPVPCGEIQFLLQQNFCHVAVYSKSQNRLESKRCWCCSFQVNSRATNPLNSPILVLFAADW